MDERCKPNDVDCEIDRGIISDDPRISQLIKDLGSDNGPLRRKARAQLVALGEPAIQPLTRAAASRSGHLAWEAVKTLSEIGHPAAARALVHALDDQWGGIAWVAADGLVTLGRDGLEPLLAALAHDADSPMLRQGAYHVLHQLAVGDLEATLRPVLLALKDVEPRIAVPIAAGNALRELIHGPQRLAS